MIDSHAALLPEKSVSLVSAIYNRRAVRDFRPDKIDSSVIRKLLDAAVHAPTAVHEEPWAFVVIQDKDLLNDLSDSIKKNLALEPDLKASPSESSFREHALSPEFNAFYNAETLVMICGKPIGPFVVSDCWLAAENFMLAAYAEGLGTCVIGLSVAALNTPEWKKRFKIPPEMTIFAPIILGIPASVAPIVPRKPAEILLWQ